MEPQTDPSLPMAPSALGDVDFDGLPSVEDRGPFGAEWWLATRLLRAGAGEAFVSVVTVLSILGVVVGVGVLNAVLSVMTGFEDDLRDKILGANAHVVVMKYGGPFELDDEMLQTVEDAPGIHHVAPFVYSEMMIRSRFGTSGIIFKGIDPERIAQVPDIREQLTLGIEGELTGVAQQVDLLTGLDGEFVGRGPDADDDPLPGILLGDELADQLQVLPGDRVQVINPLGSGRSMLGGMPTPVVRMYRVAGVFHSGMFEYDTKWTYVSVGQAESFLKQDGLVTGLEIRVDDIDEVEEVSRGLEEALGYPYYARHWRDMNQALFEALALEKIVMSLILGLIIVVAGMLVISVLYMLVLTKQREIAILKAMGATHTTVMRVFVLVGAVIGLVGATLGSALGYGLCRFLAWYEWPLDTNVYYLTSLPVVIEPINFVVVALLALGVCLAATIAPAMRASALDPVEGLRYE